MKLDPDLFLKLLARILADEDITFKTLEFEDSEESLIRITRRRELFLSTSFCSPKVDIIALAARIAAIDRRLNEKFQEFCDAGVPIAEQKILHRLPFLARHSPKSLRKIRDEITRLLEVIENE